MFHLPYKGNLVPILSKLLHEKPPTDGLITFSERLQVRFFNASVFQY